jgi:hypothetical protein
MTAIAIRPEVANWARDDEDLANLRDEPKFRALAGFMRFG